MKRQINQIREVYGYIRVSLKRQVQGASLDEQKRVIAEFCERHNLKVIGFIQDVQTAAKSGRKNFEKMMKDTKQGKADGIVFHKVDRSSRNYHDWLAVSELMDAGLYFAFASEGLESTDPAGRFTMDILAATAIHFIRNLRSETRKGMRGRIEQGRWPLPAPLGYLEPPKGTPKEKRCRKRLDPVRAPLILELFKLYATGKYTLERLQEEMFRRGLSALSGKPLPLSRVAAILDNPFYAGLLPYDGRIYPGKHPPIIDQELFSRVRELRKNKWHAIETKHSHLLQQLLVCTNCKRILTPELQKGHTYYRCHNRQHASNSIREEAVSDSIHALLKQIKPSPNEQKLMLSLLTQEIQNKNSEHDALEQKLRLEENKLEGQAQRAVEAYLNGVLREEMYKQQDSRLALARKKVAEQRTKLKQSDLTTTVTKALTLFEQLALAYVSAKKPEQRQLLRGVCSNFSVSGKNVSIEPRKWVKVMLEREKFLSGSPSRQKIRTCQNFLEELREACLEDTIHIEAVARLLQPAILASEPTNPQRSNAFPSMSPKVSEGLTEADYC